MIINLHWVRALTVPMHLGFLDGPFVPHSLISAQESPDPLPKFQMAPRLKILMPSGSKKGTQIYYPFYSKVPASEFPPGSPTVPLWREIPAYRAFYISLDISLYLKGPRKGASFHVPHKRGPYGNSRPFQRLTQHFGAVISF